MLMLIHLKARLNEIEEKLENKLVASLYIIEDNKSF